MKLDMKLVMKLFFILFYGLFNQIIFLILIRFNMGSVWEVNIYCNDEKITTLKVENSSSLSDIRRKWGDAIPKDDKFHFISKNNSYLVDESSYTAKEVYKRDGEEFRIDLKTKEYLEKKPILVTVYLNEHNPNAIYIYYNTDLASLKKIAFKDKNADSLVYVTKNKILIENQNLSQFKLKDVILFDQGKRIIKMYEIDCYNRLQVIDFLRLLEERTKNGISIDWFKEREFFKKIDILAGSTISNAISEDLKNETPGNSEEDKRKSDQKYIQQYLKLLLNDDSSSAPTS